MPLLCEYSAITHQRTGDKDSRPAISSSSQYCIIATGTSIAFSFTAFPLGWWLILWIDGYFCTITLTSSYQFSSWFWSIRQQIIIIACCIVVHQDDVTVVAWFSHFGSATWKRSPTAVTALLIPSRSKAQLETSWSITGLLQLYFRPIVVFRKVFPDDVHNFGHHQQSHRPSSTIKRSLSPSTKPIADPAFFDPSWRASGWVEPTWVDILIFL